MTVHVIVQSDESGEIEYVTFIDRMTFEASDFDWTDYIVPGCGVSWHGDIQMDSIPSFPMNYTLRRE